MNSEIKILPGLKFQSIHFNATAEVLSVYKDNNTLSVRLTPITGEPWIEDSWNLLHTEWGFEKREYYLPAPASTPIVGEEKEKFTQGNWEVEFGRWAKEAPVVGFLIKTQEKDIVSLNMGNSTVINDDPLAKLPQVITQQEAKANAQLIASAPDMYRALKGLIEIAAEVSRGLMGDESQKPLDAAISAGVEALNKSVGNK